MQISELNINLEAKPLHPRLGNQPAKIERAAKSLEASFIKEMLQSAGLTTVSNLTSKTSEPNHFSSILLQAKAENLVESGVFNLSEKIISSMMAQNEYR